MASQTTAPIRTYKGIYDKGHRLLYALETSDPAEYWHQMYLMEREKHYKTHHPETYGQTTEEIDRRKGTDDEGKKWIQAQPTECDCVVLDYDYDY
jgi:hypothetical protein